MYLEIGNRQTNSATEPQRYGYTCYCNVSNWTCRQTNEQNYSMLSIWRVWRQFTAFNDPSRTSILAVQPNVSQKICYASPMQIWYMLDPTTALDNNIQWNVMFLWQHNTIPSSIHRPASISPTLISLGSVLVSGAAVSQPSRQCRHFIAEWCDAKAIIVSACLLALLRQWTKLPETDDCPMRHTVTRPNRHMTIYRKTVLT